MPTDPDAQTDAGTGTGPGTLPPVRHAIHRALAGDRLPALLFDRAETIRAALLATLPVELPEPAATALRHDRSGWPALLARLLDTIDLASILRLLGSGIPALRPACIPEPAWQEALLDAASPDGGRLDRDCAEGCATLLAEAAERLELPEADRDRLRASPSGHPVPRTGEAALVAAVLAGRDDLAVAMLAAATGLPDAAIRDALSNANRRGLVALAWKAGYNMRTAELLQRRAAWVPPHQVLAADHDGSCPMGRAELGWQIRFMARDADG